MIAPLHHYLEYHARVRPQTEFALFRGSSITYAEANAQANRFAHALLRTGGKPGDRIAYLSKNSLDMALMYLGAAKAGLVPVPLNYRLAPMEWDYILRDCRARLLFAQEPYVAFIEPLREHLSFVEQFIVTDGVRPGWVPLALWLADVLESNPERGVVTGDSLYQMYTSGTTGRPKGAVLTHASVITNSYQARAALVLTSRPGDRILVVMPMFHAGGASFVVGGVVNAASMLIHENFSAESLLEALERDDVVAVNMVPAMIQACIDHAQTAPPRHFPKLRLVIYGASPIAESTLRQGMELFGCDFAQGFGQTESSAVLTFLPAEEHRRALDGHPELLLSAGYPVLGTELRIVDPEGRNLPVGELGEILARGPQLMQGYWNQPEQTARVLADGWLRTGDAGFLDEAGRLYVRDRVKDTIVSGGENIYSREVEDVLLCHPDIADVAVIGVPDRRYGEAVLAVVVPQSGATPVADELIAFCRERLGGYKIPRRFSFVESLPRTATGKVLKRELRALYRSGDAGPSVQTGSPE